MKLTSTFSSTRMSLTGILADKQSLTIDPTKVWVGDPPVGQAYPGTWDNMYPFRTGDFPDQLPYIGDPVPSTEPIKVIPDRIDIIPGSPWIPTVDRDWWKKTHVLSQIVSNPWRIEHLGEKSVFKCDVPGCRADGVKVQVSDRELSVVAARYDGGGSSTWATALDVSLYDVKEAVAVVADGVVSVSIPYVSKRPAQPFQVPVSG